MLINYGHVKITGQAIGGDADDSTAREVRRAIDTATTSGADVNEAIVSLGGSVTITDSVVGDHPVRTNRR